MFQFMQCRCCYLKSCSPISVKVRCFPLKTSPSTVPNSCRFSTHHSSSSSSLSSSSTTATDCMAKKAILCARMFTNAFKVIYIPTGRVLLLFPLFLSSISFLRSIRLFVRSAFCSCRGEFLVCELVL